jgi:signal transduction histidine kinase
MASWRSAITVKARRRDPFGRLFLLTAPLLLGLLVVALALGPETSAVWSGGLGAGTPGGQAATFLVLLDAIAVTLLIGAGCSAILRWRLARESVSLMVGLATVTLGIAWMIPTRLLGPAFDVGGSWVSAAAGVGVLVSAAFLLLGLRHPRGTETRRPVGAKRWGGLVVVGGIATAVIISVWGRPAVVQPLGVDEQVALFAFASLGSLYLLAGHQQRRWLHGWMGLGLLALCFAELQAAFSGGRMTFLVAAGLLRFTAAGIVLNGVVRELIDAYVAQQQRLFSAVLNVQAVEIGKAATQSREAEIRHDLRSGLLAIQAAMGAFSRTRADSEYLSGTTLTDAVSAEIKRLWSLADETSDEPIVYDLAEAIEPSVACHGAMIDLETEMSGGLLLRGHPDALVGAIVNLLANARVHAPGASVGLTAARVGPFVEIEVTDDGPGVADEVRPRLFDRGFTTRPDGSGLGLDIALQLTRSEGGDLFCDRPEVGSRFRMVLPAARGPAEEPTIDLTEGSVTSR